MKRGWSPLETELIPYSAGFPPGDRWLVLAPHPDDETFGIGATLALGVRRGVEVRVVVVTDGGGQGGPAEREREAKEAAVALGLPEPEFWRFPDRSLHPGDRSLRGRLHQTMGGLRPDVVFVTSPVELHPDHRALALAVQRTLRTASLFGRRRDVPAFVAAFEVGTPFRPNLLVAADDAWESKRRAIACYAGQIAVRPYDQVMEALATFRTLTLSGVRKAEGLHLVPARLVARLSSRRWAGLMGVPPDAAAGQGR